MKTYRITIFQEYGMTITRVQAESELLAVAKATARMYDKQDGRITRVDVEMVD